MSAPSAHFKGVHLKILAGLAIGVALGLIANRMGAQSAAPAPTSAAPASSSAWVDHVNWATTYLADPMGKVFLRLMFMVVVPLVFAALALGVVGLGDLRKIGRVGARSLLLTVAFSCCAVGVGLLLVNAIRPGGGLDGTQRDQLREKYATRAADLVGKAKQAKTVRDTLLDIIPENPLQEMVGALDGSSKGNGMLSVMFFALVFGAAMTFLPAEKSAPLVAVLQAVFDTCMIVIGLAMKLAPIAVACLVFSVVSKLGFDILVTLLWFVVTVFAGLTFQLVVVYSLAVRSMGGLSPLTFFRRTAEAMLTAFGTSSSNATLPTALRVAEESLKLPKDISHFVLTVGATGNQNGTALYEGVVVLFLAQVFGVELTLAQQLTVILMSVLAGVGTAGVPGGSLPLIVLVLQSVGVPGEGIGIILGVDRILDMCRTVVNVTGDLAIATCVSHRESRRSPAC
ncbi:MAG: dicarboxylate/amino acid:cation symporter [Phycisphaerales bacterium]|nr:dicarboxylate/amino acid:cation symporter [Phycisphaerales bacterium]